MEVLQASASETRSQFRPAVPKILVAAAAIYAIALCLWLSPIYGVVATYSTFAMMSLPGVFIGIALFGWDIKRHPESLIFGIPLGLMLSGYVALMLGYLVSWSAPLICTSLLILAVAIGIVVMRRRHSSPLVILRVWSPIDYSVLGAMGLAVLAFVTIPFSRVGELTQFGHAFTWLFGYDFILRAAYAASITLGLPIDHIHMTGVPLQMYLVGYVLPALSYTLSGESVNLQSILLVTEVLFDLAFIGCLFAFWRFFARSASALFAAAFVALVAYSFYGWFAVAHHYAKLLPGAVAARLEGQFEFGSVSHLFQRLFMVEPQAILALSVFLFVLTLLLSWKRQFGAAQSVILGMALGVEFGIDSWLGLTLAGLSACVQLLRLWKNWRDRRLWYQSVIVATIAIIIWTTFFMVHMVGMSSGSLVSIGPYWWGLKFGAFQYVIEYGPMLLAGLLGLKLLWRDNRLMAVSLLLIAVFAISQDLFVTIAELPHFRIGNRLLPIVLLAGTAYFFEHSKPMKARNWLVLVAILLAIPTVFTDIVTSSSVLNRRQTAYVSDEDLKACEWIRTHLPHNAVVQSKPDYIGDYLIDRPSSGLKEISLVPNFAYRKSALGAEYSARSMCAGCKKIAVLREADLDQMFQAKAPAGVMAIAAKYKIDYLYVGPLEQNQYPAFLSMLENSSQFEEVYDQNSVHIFRIDHPDQTGATPFRN